MNLEQLQTKLVAAARSHPPDDRVPYSFEKRIVARLTALPVVDTAAWWARALWRAAVPCVAVTLLLAAWSFASASADSSTKGNAENLAQQFEQTLLASTGQEEIW
jgi:hypothetical protein